VSSAMSDVVIVGGSVAATRAAEAAARHAPSLSITVVSDEPNPPYERPPLSKVGLDEPLDLPALTYPAVAKLAEHGVHFALNTRAEGLDVAARTLLTSNGPIRYRSLVVATGCEPIIPPLFAGLEDVYSLRSYEDALALRAAVSAADLSVAIVGAGFIGGEFAATLVKRNPDRDVALIDLDAKPLGRFGDPVADAYRALHHEAGIHLHFGNAVVGIGQGAAGRVVELYDGTRVPADVILLGVGVRPATTWLANSSVTLDGGILCDATLRAAAGVYAAGDAVRWPNERFNATMRIEHWTTAAEQGRIAGINAVNVLTGAPPLVCSTVPYFWSDQHGVRIQFAGHRTGREDLYVNHTDDGTLFLYRAGDDITGVLAFERRAQFVKLRAALRKRLSWQDAQALPTLHRVAAPD
jgi:NADPH-dependent 2,4-dienoyl-CoA reductase/sulfur reductase-like enzyme